MPLRVQDQRAAIEFLASGAWADVPAREVACMETHGAFVFLAGERACKIKRSVRYPYMDFSTLEKRRRACENEIRVNRRTAPSLYLGAEPLVRCADGRLRIGGEGEIVEWTVMMRRFPQEDLLDRVAREHRLTRQTVVALAENVARFHAGADRAAAEDPYGGGVALEATLRESLEELEGRPDWFDRNQVGKLGKAVGVAVGRARPILDRRKRRGHVRRCHGDLHLGNVCLLEGRPTLFDAIEFNDALAWIDVLHDLAFLLMDLDQRGLRRFANLLFTRYLVESRDLDGLGVLPILLAERAIVRAKVKAATAAGADETARLRNLEREAREYLSAALVYLAPSAPRLIAIGGLSGTGKSTLAGRLAPGIGAAPGAVHLRSDVIRKKLAGVAETEKLPESAYTEVASRAVYERMTGMAKRILSAGHSVVVDGVFARPEERHAFSVVAREHCVAFTGLWLEAPLDLLAERVEGRTGDASDATAAVVRRQASFDLGVIDWTSLSAEGSPDEIEAAAKRLVEG